MAVSHTDGPMRRASAKLYEHQGLEVGMSSLWPFFFWCPQAMACGGRCAPSQPSLNPTREPGIRGHFAASERMCAENGTQSSCGRGNRQQLRDEGSAYLSCFHLEPNLPTWFVYPTSRTQGILVTTLATDLKFIYIKIGLRNFIHLDRLTFFTPFLQYSDKQLQGQVAT